MSVAASVRVSSGAIEALKWLALVCMVVDHTNAVFFARELGTWADVIGRIAFPLFAGVFGYNLARPGIDHGKILRRLLLVGAITTPVHAALFGAVGPWPLNILLTFAVAVWVAIELQAGRATLALGVFLVGGALVEYWWPGLALVLACWAAARAPRPSADALVPVGLSLAALCLMVNGNAYGLLAVPVALLVVDWAPRLPRLRGWFLWFYPAHLVAFWLLVAP